MPTNLTGEAKAKWTEAQAARDSKVKVRLLREFHSLMPKHKGTERLEMSIKRQIANLEEDLKRSRSRRTGSTRLEWLVKKEGFLQLAVLGPLNLAANLFNLLTEMNTTPYEALLHPMVGVFEAGYVQFQTILTPIDTSVGEDRREKFTNMARSADVLLIGVPDDAEAYLNWLVSWFEEHNVDIVSNDAVAEIIYAPTGGLRIVGASDRVADREIIEFLSSYGVRNAVVRISKSASLDDVESALFGRLVKKSLFIAFSQQTKSKLESMFGEVFLFDSKISIDLLSDRVLKKLQLIRVFTKPIGGDVITKPLLLKRGSQVIDAAQQIHKDLARSFSYARIWRKGVFEGVRVGRSLQLEDQDAIEIHAS